MALLLVALGAIYCAFGRGKPFRGLTTESVLPDGTVEAAATSDRPVGNAAEGREPRT